MYRRQVSVHPWWVYQWVEKTRRSSWVQPHADAADEMVNILGK